MNQSMECKEKGAPTGAPVHLSRSDKSYTMCGRQIRKKTSFLVVDMKNITEVDCKNCLNEHYYYVMEENRGK